MKHYVIELHKIATLRKTYASIQSSHRTFSGALKARRKYQAQDKRNKDLTGRKISYVIGRI